MNFLQENLVKDTVLNGGLLAAAATWLVFSALQVPVNQRAPASTIASMPAQAAACAPAAAPASAQGNADRRV